MTQITLKHLGAPKCIQGHRSANQGHKSAIKGNQSTISNRGQQNAIGSTKVAIMYILSHIIMYKISNHITIFPFIP
ncbi:hypothetical protein E1A91_A10G168000v1 [Gossypium mustelinum]|uniref:Uncharacterized protein n=1 Tax=Gossypium mustelinum TaxID=34275 RepID=A0A5D2XMR3_GOSMU|nr:hypothetical protein E1A91_A10G168000v1 [Gossypium mustelinum]